MEQLRYFILGLLLTISTAGLLAEEVPGTIFLANE